MFSSRRLSRTHSVDIWPGFVDALATLLIVMLFALMTFVVAQFYLADALMGRDQALEALNQKIQSLQTTLTKEQGLKNKAQTKIDQLEAVLASLRAKLGLTEEKLTLENGEKKTALKRLETIVLEVATLEDQIKQLKQAVQTSEESMAEMKTTHESLSKDLNAKLLEKIAELEQLNADLLALQGENADLKSSVTQLSDKLKGSISLFRSEFFANLRKVIGKRDDIRVVGDRFVFQSEVLFAGGSAELGEKGKEDLKKLAASLLEISKKIPDKIHWILRVDGHTDARPIKTSQFPSNWELSAARAIAVVKFMIQEGVPEKHLVAAGFGAFNPLMESEAPDDLARNRRIEFKLDQK